MERIYTEDKVFEQIDFTQHALPLGDYENCTFIQCDFSNSTLSSIHFTDCNFVHSNLSLCKLVNTVLADVKFTECKMLGLFFNDCSDFIFTVSFNHCMLNLSSFYKRKLKKTNFIGSSLEEVDFTDADLTAANFSNCNLQKTIFDNNILEKVDFRTAYHYSINPEKNRIKKAQFSLHGIAGLLEKYDIDITL